MKRSNFAQVIDLVKTYITEEKAWYGDELLVQRTSAPARPAVSVASAGVTGRKQDDTAQQKHAALDVLRREICACAACPLGASRLNFVFGVGDPAARLMFVGEGPGFAEDHSGEPFVGRAGQLLNKIIESIGMLRADVYIANIVKCHPMKNPSDPELRGNDRAPTAEEMACCLPHLERQIDIIKPAVICTLGASASQGLLKTDTPISALRGTVQAYKRYPVLPTYHPAALLRNPDLKRAVWEDMKQIRKMLE